ncbi:DUF6328 family protein [Kitasatospora sp. A2-31]|uniref:DUF6328 family protein n=1 Tax=Kitasatospora sp. A2-31 TaxID=2916414 RepID=UPI001EEAB5E5|nr:DUF6328 family protein [Kitasatospora sp. A2-31]MCG6494285.1 DUF6328 family protein [Kitasatospora sp. A2-31]
MTDDENSGGPGRDETPEQRADRLWNEMLQEVRVCQTGAQILFGFLLSVVFTPRFPSLPEFDRHLYVATVFLGALATGTLIAPVAFHRFLAGHGMKPELIRVAGRLISLGLVLLALTITAALLLLLRTATGLSPAAWVLTGAAAVWFCVCWLVLPQVVLRRRPNGRRPRSSR